MSLCGLANTICKHDTHTNTHARTHIIAADNDGWLTNQQYVQLARAISSRDMETIAQGYFDVDIETITLNRWAGKHPDGNQINISPCQY